MAFKTGSRTACSRQNQRPGSAERLAGSQAQSGSWRQAIPSAAHAQPLPLARPLELRRGDALRAEAPRQARLDQRPNEIGRQEGEGNGLGDVTRRAALADRDLVQGRSVQDLIQPSAAARHRAQQDRSRLRLDAALGFGGAPRRPEDRTLAPPRGFGDQGSTIG